MLQTIANLTTLICLDTHTHMDHIHMHPHIIRRRGGLDEERAERQRWNQREQEKIMNCVRGGCVVYLQITCVCYVLLYL